MTETALILLLKLSEIPKSYIHPRRLSHKGNNSNSLPYSHWSISAISQITATTTSQNKHRKYQSYKHV